MDHRDRDDGAQALAAAPPQGPPKLASSRRFALQLIDAKHRELIERIQPRKVFRACVHIFTPHPPKSVLSAPRGTCTSSVRVKPKISCPVVLVIDVVSPVRTIAVVVAST
jgi:hypothetical protein